MVEECESCKFWFDDDPDAEKEGHVWGLCRRYPPRFLENWQVDWFKKEGCFGVDDYPDHNKQPVTWPHDWCGEFVVKTKS